MPKDEQNANTAEHPLDLGVICEKCHTDPSVPYGLCECAKQEENGKGRAVRLPKRKSN